MQQGKSKIRLRSRQMNSHVLYEDGYKALVIGSSGSIGEAFVIYFQSDDRCTHVEKISRSQSTGFDLEDAASIEKHALRAKQDGPFNIIIDATGALTIDGQGPEKSLAALQADSLIRAFQINTVGPALVLKNFAPLLSPGIAIYAKLSARVGSISDNKKGGWYGYRASKAALNMILQTAAIELQRRQPELRVVALQPGTVKSKLSQPFSARVETLLEPTESVSGMMQALMKLEAKSGAHFIDYQGQEISW